MGDGLTLEKLKIDERLREVEKHMAEGNPIRQQLMDSVERLEKTLDRIDNKISGNGKDGIEQTVIKIDNRVKTIEEAEETRKKSTDTIVKAALTSVVMGIGSFLYWAAKTLLTLIK